LCISVDILIDLRLKSHWMNDIFLDCVYHSLRTAGEAISLHQLATLYSERKRNEEAALFRKWNWRAWSLKRETYLKCFRLCSFSKNITTQQIDLRQLRFIAPVFLNIVTWKARRARQPAVYLKRFNPHNSLASIVSLREAALALVLVLCVAAPFSFALCSSTLMEFVLSIYSCCFHNNFHDSCIYH
jgi:hypothetical protein